MLNTRFKFFVLVFSFSVCSYDVHAAVDSLYQFQLRDTSKGDFIPDTSYHHSWKKAVIWSACIPGSGQFYNEIGYRKVQNKKHRAWWKAPIIWGGLAAGGYYFYDYLNQAKNLKAEWLYRQDNPGMILQSEYVDWNDTELLNGKQTGPFTVIPGFDIAAKRRDVIGFAILAFWGLNVIEALVDGHFVYFDVSEDLTIRTFPVMYDQHSLGLQCSIKF